MGILNNMEKHNKNPLYTLDNEAECKETIKGFKHKMKEFCSLKKTWRNRSLSDKSKEIISVIKSIPPIEFPIKMGRNSVDKELREVSDDIAYTCLKEFESLLTKLYK